MTSPTLDVLVYVLCVLVATATIFCTWVALRPPVYRLETLPDGRIRFSGRTFLYRNYVCLGAVNMAQAMQHVADVAADGTILVCTDMGQDGRALHRQRWRFHKRACIWTLIS